MSRSVALSLAAAAAVAVTLVLAFHADDALELPLRDVALRLAPAMSARSTVVVAIDEPSLRVFGRWPWPRTLLADLIDRAWALGARGVVLDVLLAEPADGDQRLTEAMSHSHTVTIAALDNGQWRLPIAPVREVAVAAHGNFELDRDGILRRFASTKQSGNRSLAAISLEAAAMIANTPVPIGRSIKPAFRTRPGDIPIISAAQFLRSSPDIRGKVVFIGPTAVGLGDRVLTPVSRIPDPGVTVHAAATESLVRREIIREMPPVAVGALAAVAVAIILLVRKRRVAAGALVLLITIGGPLLLEQARIAIPFFALNAAVIIAIAGVEVASGRSTAQELQKLATRLAARRAQEAESKRILAHELKTPLASMRGLSQLLGGFELSEAERRRVASLLEAEAGKLQLMVGGLLDLERLPLRDFQSSSSVIDLGDLVARRVEFLKASSDRQFMMSITPGVLVRADAPLIDRVVDNLVGNALKYSPPPSPVTITVRRSEGDALVEVEDRGPGVAAGERSKIFDRFFRGSTAAGTQGLGLGLSLVSEVAQWHGGTASADDAAGGGSLFRVVLPVAAAAERVGAM